MATSRYNPTVDEIHVACAEIRTFWSEREHRRRAGWGKDVDLYDRWSPPECNARDLGLIEGRAVYQE